MGALALNCYAGNASLFDLNEEALSTEFAELSSLEDAVVADAMMTFDAAQEQNLVPVALSSSAALPASGDFQWEWGGFLWGFLCCPVGFFVVAINGSKSHSQKTSYWIGVGASVVLSAITSGSIYL